MSSRPARGFMETLFQNTHTSHNTKEAGEIAEGLGVLDVFLEDLNSIPSTLQRSVILAPGDLIPSLATVGTRNTNSIKICKTSIYKD